MPDPLPTLSPDELARYSRHLLLGEIGVEGQRKLAAARVLVVGAGGLGSPVALYLAAAGVGTLGIADFDRVAVHNLQRQLLHDDKAVGTPKTISAANRLRSVNPFVKILEHPEGVTEENALKLFAAYDLIVDGTDNFTSRYLMGDAAFLAKKPLIFGSVFKFEGQVTIFDSNHDGPCHRCLFPEPPDAGSVPGCGEAGVLGALCGVIGSLQALETIKFITQIGEPLRGRLLTYDALTQHFQMFTLPRDLQCPLCGAAPSLCDLQTATSATDTCQANPKKQIPTPDYPLELSVTEAKRLLDEGRGFVMLIDVRESYEFEICHIAKTEHIPMRQIPEQLGTLPRDKYLLILCHHGTRSLRVTEFLRENGLPAVSNISGGIDAWSNQIDNSLRRY